MKTDKLLYGAAYYDEYMPYDRIETDFQMNMKHHVLLMQLLM